MDEIKSIVLNLPRADRERIRAALLASLQMDPEAERAWHDEVRHRIREIDAGRTELVPGEEVVQEVDDLLQAPPDP